ncbi:hypothetical protein AC578_9458 [Pseudocercospora eumusae]|uniref:Uncharacterized protein n=1 Tax=Pseudocercospora eumusae TaxID=321146 RepID=A0A139GYI8_9PEZI|nr:hypothetical protein AC578_9458 [Pseudocercospora eumusae]
MATGPRERNAAISPAQPQSSPVDFDVEKKGATTSTSELRDRDVDTVDAGAWRPGVFAQFPWMGIGALLFVLILSGCSLFVLGLANGKTQDIWPNHFKPNSVLTLLNNGANICFSIAIANGVAIAWWRRAVKGGTIEDLHKSWTFSTSLKEALFAGKGFNVIALAALTAKSALIDGYLMQSALSTYIAPNTAITTNVNGFANTTFRLTGQTLGGTAGDDDTNKMDLDILKDLLIWDERPQQLPLNGFWNCDGLCFLKVPAAGFEIDCSSSSASIDFQGYDSSSTVAVGAEAPDSSSIGVGGTQSSEAASPTASSAGITVGAENPDNSSITRRQDSSSDPPSIIITNGTNVTNIQGFQEQTIFNVAIHSQYTDLEQGDYSNVTDTILQGGRPSNLTIDITYTQASATNDLGTTCSGSIYKQTCTLRPAIYKYPVMIQNYTLGIRHLQGVSVGVTEESYLTGRSDMTTEYDPISKQQIGFEFVAYQDIYEHYSQAGGTIDVNTTLAGLQRAFEVVMGGQANASYGGTGGWQLTQDSSAQLYSSRDANGGCARWYENPLDPSRQTNVHVKSVVSSINQIMFAISTNITNNATLNPPPVVNQYSAVQFRDTIHYRTNWTYGIGAIASTFFCVLCVLPVYWGWWQLGRKVTLGPFEIAHAFRSPMTAQAANGGIEELLKQVGHREVQYGHIVAGDAKGVLGVAEPEFVERLPTK